MSKAHTDRAYEAELAMLRDKLLLMGARVEEMLGAAMAAVAERDVDRAHRAIALDQEVDRLEMECDDQCLVVLARRQPVASDLRFITMALKLVTNLERIGDMGVNICERAIELAAEPPLKAHVDMAKMGEHARQMVRGALDAFVKGDATTAERVISEDSALDAYYVQTFRELLTYMMEDPRNISRATRIQAIAKYLERIGDHATNIAEMVIFMVRGADVRHQMR